MGIHRSSFKYSEKKNHKHKKVNSILGDSYKEREKKNRKRNQEKFSAIQSKTNSTVMQDKCDAMHWTREKKERNDKKNLAVTVHS